MGRCIFPRCCAVVTVRGLSRTCDDGWERGEACRVVSTQVVEAGVDLDFPVVMRAVGPLDSIIQAAGRCNRAGRMDAGRVVVFQPKEGSAPPLGSYKLATDTTLRMLNAGPLDLDNPETVTEFFRGVYQFADHDAKGIQEKRRSFDYPEVASRFRMIDDATLKPWCLIWYCGRTGAGWSYARTSAQRNAGGPVRDPFTAALDGSDISEPGVRNAEIGAAVGGDAGPLRMAGRTMMR